MRTLPKKNIGCALAALLLIGCEGPLGPAGKEGTPGQNGSPGDAGSTGPSGPSGLAGPSGAAGANGCDGLLPGQTRGLFGTVAVSAPANGKFFVAGEQSTVTIKITDRCGKKYSPSDLASAALYLHGPRSGLATTTACGMLNCVTDRKVSGHHRIDLDKPVYADSTQANLSTAADGTLTYLLNPVSNELAGTYTAALFAKSKDDVDQLYASAELQIGSDVREEFATGPAPSDKCAACHKSPMSGHFYLHHSHPGRSAYGSFNNDAEPIETCLACHNRDGYSANLVIAKTHSIHRGEHLTNPGLAHPEYGLGAQDGIAAFSNVGFPRMPGGERDCIACHADNRWQTRPSRMACGTCHDNVFFDSGTLSPPRQFTKACTVDADCTSLGGSFLSCDNASLLCVRASHPIQDNDTQCLSCHGEAGFSPIAGKHEIYQRTHDPGLQFTDVVLTIDPPTGAPPAFFSPGDTPVIQFKLQDAAGNFVADLKTNTAVYSTSLTVTGPTDEPQQLYSGSANLATKGTLTYDTVTHLYTYKLASALPANAVPPLNHPSPLSFSRPNPKGTYTAWLWVYEKQKINGEDVRNTASMVINFPFLEAVSSKPRQVIAAKACDSCHDNLQAHGGGRQEPGTCFTCHTAGAEDRAIGSVGTACVLNSDCKGNALGWESCQNSKCTITQDPTPGTSIDFRVMVHKLHFARLLDGYAELANLIAPGRLQYVGFNNTPTDEALSEILLPQDVRSCKTCHTDSGAICSVNAPCGYGQSCIGGRCVNEAWMVPSTAVCLSCHDTAAAYGHAQLNTWTSGASSLETCEVCHGGGSQFSVKNAHNISNPYVPPYAREKE